MQGLSSSSSAPLSSSGYPPTSSPQASRPQAAKVCAIILNWNQAQLSLACLESLERQDLAPGQQMDCLIVDNGSDDDSRQVFEKALDHRSRGKKDRRLHSSGTRPAVSLLLLAENRGFAGGMNAGIRHALESGYDHVLILNNDTLADWNIGPRVIECDAGETGRNGRADDLSPAAV